MTASGGNASTADTLGWIHYLLGNYEQAEKLLSEGATQAPGNAEIHLHLAHNLAALGQSDAARAALAKSLQLDPALADRDDVKKLRAQLGAR